MITCWPTLYSAAGGKATLDRAIIERARAPRTYARKDQVPRWAGAVFQNGYRALAHVQRVSWAIYDFDASAERAQIAMAFGKHFGVAHTTWTPGRWRVGLVLSRHVTVEDQPRVWRAGAAIAERHGLAPDYAAKSAAHCFALPARHDGDSYEHLELAGESFDVEAALAAIPKPQPTEQPPRSADVGDSYERRLERAARYLDRMPGAISGSHGHATTFAAAVAMVRGFALDPDDALRLLVEVHNPQCAPAWTERDLRHKVRQALQRAKMPFGAIIDRPRDGVSP